MMRPSRRERYTAAMEKVKEARREIGNLSAELDIWKASILRIGMMNCSLIELRQLQMLNEALIRLERKRVLADGVARGDVTFPQPSSAQGTISTPNHTTDINKDLVTHGKKAERGSGQ